MRVDEPEDAALCMSLIVSRECLKVLFYRLLVTIVGSEKRLLTRFPSNPSSSNFNPVQSISRVRTFASR